MCSKISFACASAAMKGFIKYGKVKAYLQPFYLSSVILRNFLCTVYRAVSIISRKLKYSITVKQTQQLEVFAECLSNCGLYNTLVH